VRLAWQNRILQTCGNRTVFKRHRRELTSMISLNESCNCRMDNWQSSPTCSVGNTSKSGWNTPLVHYCIDGWDLMLFQLSQTIHAMYKDHQAEIVLTGRQFEDGASACHDGHSLHFRILVRVNSCNLSISDQPATCPWALAFHVAYKLHNTQGD
jgi:hypothetical protein